MTDDTQLCGPDLTAGVQLDELGAVGRLLGHAGEDAVLLVRDGAEVFAVGAQCTHYGGPLVDGLVVDGTVRCPWHHDCFDLRSGEALPAPALTALPCWSVEQRDGRLYVRDRRPPPKRNTRPGSANVPDRIVIIGGGAAAFTTQQTLRDAGFAGSIVMISDDEAAPVDRPNLSKDYLAGSAPQDWLPLRSSNYYAENDIDLRLQTRAVRIDTDSRAVTLSDGSSVAYDRLLLAAEAEPRRLTIPGADRAPVHYLRSLADCEAIVERTQTARRAVVLGASFIGLEVAAALHARDIEVHVVAPEQRPMELVLGAQLGDFIRALHEAHGVTFHLGTLASAIDGRQLRLNNGRGIEADLIVAGIGVRPKIELAEEAGLAIDRGVTVDACLQTSVPGIFAAGDIARWPDPHSGDRIRVEHWVLAERQGRTAALNLLGQHNEFTAMPFFWTQQYEVPIAYVGHAQNWDAVEVEGEIAGRDALVRFRRTHRTLAVATIFRDIDRLEAELAMEHDFATRRR